MSRGLDEFAAQVGDDGPVCVAGGRTHWGVGGLPDAGTSELTAPSGVVSHEPAEMVVRVGAGTTVSELLGAVGESGQTVAIDGSEPDRATVGGALACGRSALTRLRWGPVRDTLLEASFVTAEGKLIRAGAPLVKNVTGFDICRLLVGSLGTLGLLAEVVLRCVPAPAVETWWAADGVDPFLMAAALYRPGAVLWNGRRTWVCLCGHPADVAQQASEVLGSSFSEVGVPPDMPGRQVRSLPPSALRSLPTGESPSGRWMAQVGVGTVHLDEEAAAQLAAPAVASSVVALNRAVKERFDPSGRLSPGRDPLRREHPSPAGSGGRRYPGSLS